MATLWQRMTGTAANNAPAETRATPPVVPTRANTLVTADTALTLTAVYRAVQIIATPISKMPLDTFRYATGLEVKIDAPLLVNRPSLNDTRRNFLYETVVSLALNGNAFWIKGKAGNGAVNDLTILPPETVAVRQTELGVKVFDYNGKTYSSDTIEHLKLFPRAGQLRGISPIEACRSDLAAVMDLRDYAANWFSSAGVPTGVLKAPTMLTGDDAAAVTAAWHTKQQNRQIGVLGMGWDYQQISLSPKDALFTEVQSQAVQSIARLFGVPARLLLTAVDGTSDTYVNLQDENQVFYRHTLTGFTDAIADALTNCLGRGTRVEFNFEGLFKADQAARFNMWQTALAAEFMTVDEVRAKEGLNV